MARREPTIYLLGVILESRGIGKQPQLRTTNCRLLSQSLERLRSEIGSAWPGNGNFQTRHPAPLQLHQERKLGTLRNGDTNLLATA